MNEQQQKDLADVKERLSKLELLVPNEHYAHIFQSLRNDVRTLIDIVEEQERAKDADVLGDLVRVSLERKQQAYDAFVASLNTNVE